MFSTPNQISENVAVVLAEIAGACQRVGRHPNEVTIVAVTKQRSVDEIEAVVQAGVNNIAENRVEEAMEKIDHLRRHAPQLPIRWHMVGHVQSRKARDVVDYFDVIHSLDTLKLGQKYHEFAQQSSKLLRVLLELNVSGEAAKYGFEADQWQTSKTQRETLWAAVNELHRLGTVEIAGLMTMAPLTADDATVRSTFVALREVRDALRADFSTLELPELSMGMTNDYPIAVEEGATMVRIGRAIFGDMVE